MESWKSTNMAILKDSRDKIKCSQESGMQTDQAEQLDTLLNQSAKVLNKSHDTKETDASIPGAVKCMQPTTPMQAKLS